MREVHGDLFEFRGFDVVTHKLLSCDHWAIVIPTNGVVRTERFVRGRAVMGKGVALLAVQHWSGLDLALGTALSNGNNVHLLTHVVEGYTEVRHVGWAQKTPSHIVSFPTKHSWRRPADLELIRRSAVQLKELTTTQGWKQVALPAVGCGAGELKWDDVRAVIAPILDDDRFVVLLQEPK